MAERLSGGNGQRTKAIPTISQSVVYLLRVVKLMQPFWPGLGKGLIMGVGIGLVGLIVPYLSKLYFDKVYPSHDVSLLRVLIIGGLVLGATLALVSSVKSYFGATVSGSINRAMSLMFFNQIQHLTLRFFDEHRVGEVTSRFQDVRASIDTVSQVFQTVILSGAFVVLVPPILLYLNPELAALSFITVPITVAISTGTSHWVRRLSKESLEASAELSAFQVETLTHVRTLRGMAAEHFIYRSADEQLQRVVRLQLSVALVSSVVAAINGVVRTVGQGCLGGSRGR
jgi:ABC-type bacteriocin/lantibiotic exporter with double-glycine peptidase domain